MSRARDAPGGARRLVVPIWRSRVDPRPGRRSVAVWRAGCRALTTEVANVLPQERRLACGVYDHDRAGPTRRWVRRATAAPSFSASSFLFHHRPYPIPSRPCVCSPPVELAEKNWADAVELVVLSCATPIPRRGGRGALAAPAPPTKPVRTSGLAGRSRRLAGSGSAGAGITWACRIRIHSMHPRGLGPWATVCARTLDPTPCWSGGRRSRNSPSSSTDRRVKVMPTR